MEKKTKLSISGSAKKSIKNIEIAKTQGKNSVVIEKQTGKLSSRGGSFRSSINKTRTTSTLNRGAPVKPPFNLKGLTPGMLVTLGEQKILSLEDFADLASDELTGGYDVVKGERVKIQGYLEDFALSKDEADELIMSARNIVYKD